MNAHDLFDIPTAVRMARLGEIAYLDRNAAQIETRALGYHKFEWFDVDDMKAFVCANAEHVVYSIAGTDEVADWRFNLNSQRLAYKSYRYPRLRMKIHAGFQIAADKLNFHLRQQIAQWFRDGLKLYGVGHSLGAAAATLYTDYQEVPVDGLFLFGSPRVGNRRFAKYFNTEYPNTWRFVNNNDLVTRVPTALRGFWHVGQQVYFDYHGRMFVNAPLWRRLFNQIAGRWAAVRHQPREGISYVDGIHDHSMTRYLTKLQQLERQLNV